MILRIAILTPTFVLPASLIKVPNQTRFASNFNRGRENKKEGETKQAEKNTPHINQGKESTSKPRPDSSIKKLKKVPIGIRRVAGLA